VGMAVVLAAALNGIAVLQAYTRVFTGKRYFPTISLQSRGPERLAVLTLAILILGGGIFPQPGLSSRHHAANGIINARRRAMGMEASANEGHATWWFGHHSSDSRPEVNATITNSAPLASALDD
jgi:NADH-quinone oxidoreductase subunit M